LVAAAGVAHGTYERDANQYVIYFGAHDPASATEAAATLAARKTAVIDAAACKADLAFWADTWSDNPRARGEGSDFIIFAKAGRLLRDSARWPDAKDSIACDEALNGTLSDLLLPESRLIANEMLGNITAADDLAQQASIVNSNKALWSDQVKAVLTDQVKGVFPACSNAVASVEVQDVTAADLEQAIATPAERAKHIRVNVHIKESLACLKDEVNVALQRREVQGRVGSSGLPCPLDGAGEGEGPVDPDRDAFVTTGEWDVQMRDLIRILYLNERSGNARMGVAPWILDPKPLKHVREDLILLNTYLGQESYSVLQCGNQEDAHGDALDRLEQRDWAQKALDSLGDLLSWLWHHAALVAIALGGGAAALALFPYFAPVVVPAVAVALVGGATARTPETENHRLMIETTRYLHNQLLLGDLKRDDPDDDLSTIEDDQKEVRQWLMNRLRTIYHDDFSEYNALPYQRYSLISLLNLADFAEDSHVSDAARMVLTTTAAKAALETEGSMRFVPYRRRLESMNKKHFCSQDADGLHCLNMFDLGEASDYFVPLWELWSGQTPQHQHKVNLEAAKDLTPAATSDYSPPAPITALTISDEQAKPRWQIRNHYKAPEITYSERAFLITGGGVEADPANYLEFSVLGVAVKPLHSRADDGTAVTTTLQFRSLAGLDRKPEPDNGSLANLIRIYGDPHFDKDHVWTTSVMPLQAADAKPLFTNNLCIYRTFACGVNVSLPADFAGCLVSDPQIPGLAYLDTDVCDAIKNVEHTYVAIDRSACDNDATAHDCHNMGFFEAFAAPSPGSGSAHPTFAEFMERVRTRNAAKTGIGFHCKDQYVTARGAGDTIAYHCDDEYAIRTVNGVDITDYRDELPAKGNVIVRTGDGYIHTIWWPERNTFLRLDWSDPDNPVHP
jgi:hypothetical protein